MTLHSSLAAPKVSIHNGKAITTSLDVAVYFGKLHKNVIRSIETLDCSPEFNRLNFEPVDYIDAKGEKRPMYTMTKDGFVFLVMGFTGKKAAAFKEAYIAEFNRMEAALTYPNYSQATLLVQQQQLILQLWLISFSALSTKASLSPQVAAVTTTSPPAESTSKPLSGTSSPKMSRARS
ncbi:Rha family transcriptional regulator [Candidatus Sodalis pierantonius]|uniref:Rha family transcriptional regulator n=1 Tax=Candidatus Sodalis pierantonii TaxID=1486991 RepID=UPI00046CE688